MSQMSVILGPERRRRWRPEEKLALLAEAFAPGAVVLDVARRHEVSTSLIYKWRQQAMGAPGFVPAVIAGEAQTPAVPAPWAPVIVVELGAGRVSIGAGAPADLVTAALKALK